MNAHAHQNPQPNGAVEPDPLASLHKMSRTAGLGAQDYVAINACAVAAMLLGMASVLIVLELSVVLAVIPVAAMVVGIVAIRQIRKSSGTQGGRGLATAGVVLAMLFVGVLGAKLVWRHQQIEPDRRQLLGLIEQLGLDLNQGSYEAAWQRFSPRFQERVPKDDFTNTFKRFQASQFYGRIKSMQSNGIIDVQQDLARGLILIELEHGQTDRREAQFRKVGQHWVIEDLEGYFAPPARVPQQARQ